MSATKRLWLSVAAACAGAAAMACSSSDTSSVGGDSGSDATSSSNVATMDGGSPDAMATTNVTTPDGTTPDVTMPDGKTPDAAGDVAVGEGGQDSADAGAVDPCALTDANSATVSAGPLWGCYQTACASELAVCAADCVCNDAILLALVCSANGTPPLTCFGDAYAQTRAEGNVVIVLHCLTGMMATCTAGTGPGADASSDSPADVGGESSPDVSVKDAAE